MWYVYSPDWSKPVARFPQTCHNTSEGEGLNTYESTTQHERRQQHS